jgi:molecular chaperone GrpE (heat shock protein)
MNAFISFELDHTVTRINRQSLEGDVDETRRIAQQLEHANQIWSDFAINSYGNVIFLAGPEGKISIPADKLNEVSAIVCQYAEANEDTVSVGVGMGLQESVKALLAAKLTGGDRIHMYDEATEKLLQEAKNSKLEKSELQMNTSPGALERFHNMAQAYEQTRAVKEQELARQQELAQIKAELVQVLQQLKAAAPELAQLQATAPETYQSISMMTRSLLALAQEVTGVPLTQASPQQQQQTTGATPADSSSHMNIPTYKAPKAPHATIPVGAIRNGKIKVKVGDQVAWRSVRSGLGVDADGIPTSVRNLDD